MESSLKYFCWGSGAKSLPNSTPSLVGFPYDVFRGIDRESITLLLLPSSYCKRLLAVSTSMFLVSCVFLTSWLQVFLNSQSQVSNALNAFFCLALKWCGFFFSPLKAPLWRLVALGSWLLCCQLRNGWRPACPHLLKWLACSLIDAPCFADESAFHNLYHIQIHIHLAICL